METKSKTFARKLIALLLSAILAISCFTGAVTAYAKSSDDFHDSNLASNFLTWAETTDEQTAEALLDWVDLYLDDLILGLNLNVGGGIISGDRIYLNQNVVVATIKIDGYIDSVDGICDLIRQANDILNSYGSLVGGSIKNIDLSPIPSLSSVTQGDEIVSKCNRSYRAVNSAKDILMALAKTIYINSNDNSNNKNVIGSFLKGTFDLGLIGNFVGGDVYSLLQSALGMWDGYKTNLVYNIVAKLVIENTNWYTDDQIASFENYLKGNGGTTFNFDDQLFEKLTTELIQKINVQITYPDNELAEDGTQKKTSSKLRYQEIQDYMSANKCDITTASKALGFDENLYYTDSGNVYIFKYGSEALSISKTDSLFDIAFKGIQIAWKTVLQPTLSLLHVNYSVNREGAGTNFDNVFYYWMRDNKKWNEKDWKSNYSQDNINAWAKAQYAEYDYKSADEFLEHVKENFSQDRTVVEDEQDNWRDIDSTKLFNKLRYSPLADLGFDMQTGPINLYFLQTGIPNLTNFFNSVAQNYTNVVEGFNDCLVAAVKDFFPDSDNIGLGDGNDKVTTNLSLPTMTTTGKIADLTSTDATKKSAAIDKIATTLVSNAFAVFEYAANATDENILNPYYKNNNITTKKGNLNESNFEEAMVPFLISCLQNVTMTETIHTEDWDTCADAEGVAYVCLAEYLSYSLPSKDYSQLISYDSNGKIVAGKIDISGDGKYTLFDDAILPMCRDAVGYLLSSIVPCRDKSGKEWDVYKSDLTTDKTTLFDLLNSVVCYYASTDTYNDGSGTSNGKAVASLLGAVDGSGNCLVKSTNTLWQNIDAVANEMFPIIGTLEYGTSSYKSKASSEDLVYNKLIKGILDIGPNSGITTILKQILTTFTSEPLTKGIDVMVYDDIVADTANAILGARDSRQGYTTIIPKSSYYDSDGNSNTSSSTPFDSLVQSNTLAYYSGGDSAQNGILGLIIGNIYEFFGGNMGSYSTQAMADGCWTGAMFAVEAVNNFIPSFVPQLSEHNLEPASLYIDNVTQTGLVAGAQRASTYLEFTNNSIGLNRFWRDKNGTINRDKRYFMNITKVDVTNVDGTSPTNFSVTPPTDSVVAPESTVKIPLTGKNISGTQNLAFTVTYDIFEGELDSAGNKPSAPASSDCLYSGLTATCYLYLSSDNSWETAFFNQTDESTGIKSNSGSLLSSYTSSSNTVSGITVNYFKNFIVSTASPSGINDLGLPITGSSDSSVSNIYSYLDSTTEYYPLNDDYDDFATTKTTGAPDGYSYTETAYAAIDSDGNILNYDKYDVIKNGKLDRGEKNSSGGYDGYTEAQVQSFMENSPSVYTGYSTHIAYTIDEALENFIALGADREISGVDDDGTVSYTYNSVLIDKEYLDNVSPGTPTKGIYLVSGTKTPGSGTKYFKWIAYDGSTSLSANDYNLSLAATVGSSLLTGKTHLIISNDTEASKLQNLYNKYLSDMAPYTPIDFADYTVDKAGNGESVIYDNVQSYLRGAVTAVATPVNESNAASLVSTSVTVERTASTTSELGDEAFAPIPTSTELSLYMASHAYSKGGYYYYDEACTMPIYSNTALTDDDVKDGKNKVGDSVVKGEDGKYYMVNDVQYATKWDTTTYYTTSGTKKTYFPYLTTTSEQAVDEKDNPLYSRIQYQYLNENGDKVGSDDNWAYKMALTTTTIKENDTNDYRGLYQKYIDALEYWVGEAKDHINSEIASEIGVGVTEDRTGLDSVNYNVASYEKMVRVAKEGEKLITTTEDEEGNKTYSTSSASIAINEAVRIYNIYKNRVIKRSYEGDKLEAEIEHSTNFTKNDLSITKDGSVAYTTANTQAKYGVFDSSKKLVNSGSIIYTTDSWNDYTEALANAVETAQSGDAEIAETYIAKKALVIAENNLTPDTTMIITGKVVAAVEPTGTETTGNGVAGLDILEDGNVVATTNSDGTFTATISQGTTELTIKGGTAIERTVKLSGENAISDANIPVVVCDYNKDGKINTTDALLLAKNSGSANAIYDMDASGSADAKDGAIFKSFFRHGVNYSEFSLD